MMQTRSLPVGSHGGSMHIKSRVPTCVQPEYWRRHNLSRKDIDIIISYVPTKVIWMSAMMYGICCPWFTLRSSSASMMDVTLSGKALAIDLLLEKAHLKPSEHNKLDVDSIESFEHIPPIPKSIISLEDFGLISSGVVSQLLPRLLLQPSEVIGIIPLVYRYKDMDVVPVGIEGDSICCNVVVLESLYTYVEQHRRGFTHCPKVGQYKGHVYCLTDELLLLCTGTSQ
jgi:hypothetical protein